MAALSKNYHLLCLSFSVMAIIFFSLTFLPPHGSGGIESSSSNGEELRKMVLGSRPPACLNKCMSCRPCDATLVIPSHQDSIKHTSNYQKSFHRDQDDSYYLLSWKCRCGNKLYQP